MSDPHDNLTVAILREIRDEIVTTRSDLGARIESGLAEVRTELGHTNARLEVVETTLLEMAEQPRFVVRHLGVLAGRDRVLETDVDELKARVDAIERRLASSPP